MNKLIDKIKLIGIKREFNKICKLVLENSDRTYKKRFSDGTPYTEKELNKRIEDRCNHVNSMVGKVDKEENIELHKIELLSSNENETIDDVEEKLKILN